MREVRKLDLMIPALNDKGYLPLGIHRATLDELLHRFGHGSEQRLAQAESLRWLMPICVRAGIVRALVNGSFVTNRAEPNDVDCALLQGPAYNSFSIEAAELRQGLPFLELVTGRFKTRQRGARFLVFKTSQCLGASYTSSSLPTAKVV